MLRKDNTLKVRHVEINTIFCTRTAPLADTYRGLPVTDNSIIFRPTRSPPRAIILISRNARVWKFKCALLQNEESCQLKRKTSRSHNLLLYFEHEDERAIDEHACEEALKEKEMPRGTKRYRKDP